MTWFPFRILLFFVCFIFIFVWLSSTRSWPIQSPNAPPPPPACSAGIRHDTHMHCIRTSMICFRIHHTLLIALRSRPAFIITQPGLFPIIRWRGSLLHPTSYTDLLFQLRILFFFIILPTSWFRGRTKRQFGYRIYHNWFVVIIFWSFVLVLGIHGFPFDSPCSYFID